MQSFYFEGLGEYLTLQDGTGLWCVDKDDDGNVTHGRIFRPSEFSVAGLSKIDAARKIRARLSDDHESRCVAAYVAEGLGE
jgi:hypothetical protein